VNLGSSSRRTDEAGKVVLACIGLGLIAFLLFDSGCGQAVDMDGVVIGTRYEPEHEVCLPVVRGDQATVDCTTTGPDWYATVQMDGMVREITVSREVYFFLTNGRPVTVRGAYGRWSGHYYSGRIQL